MKRLSLAIFSILLFFSIQSQNVSEKLTNKEIIAMSEVGMDYSTIINKINYSDCSFDVSTMGLIALKKGNVSKEVMDYMIDYMRLKENEMSFVKNPGNINFQNLNESGIFWVLDSTSGIYKNLDATAVTGGSFTSQGLSLGQKTSIAGKSSNIIIDDNTPLFYFYFDKSNSSLNNTGSYFAFLNSLHGALASTPNDFKLVRLNSEKGSRSFSSLKFTRKGVEYGIDGNSIIPFTYDRIARNIYLVKINTPLRNGEYCFYYAANSDGEAAISETPTSSTRIAGVNQRGVRVFDFTIQIKPVQKSRPKPLTSLKTKFSKD